MTIEQDIIQPLQEFIDGHGSPMHRYRIVQCARECREEGQSGELHHQMQPFYSMYLDDSARLDWNSRGMIADIARLDPHFGEWASHQDMMKLAHAWAVRGNADDLLTLMDCMIQGEYEPWDGQSYYNEVTEELRYQRVNGSVGSGQIYAVVHAFMTVVLSTHRYDRHKELFALMKAHWDFLRHLYSVMTGSIIGLNFSNFTQLANNLKNAKYLPYLHLVYWFLSDRADTLCTKQQQRGMTKALAALEDHLERTELNHELDELCQLLFPDEVRDMLEKHPKTPYRQLETENRVLKAENTVLKTERRQLREELAALSMKHETITRQMAEQLQRAVIEDAIPFKEIEEELLGLKPDIVEGVFNTLNGMLGGNDVWHKHFRSLREKVRCRRDEKDEPQMPSISIGTIDNRSIAMTGDSPYYDETKYGDSSNYGTKDYDAGRPGPVYRAQG